jgi:mannosyltransferase
MRLSNSTQKIIILGLTLLAFLLRAYRLEGQSYWIEEAWTLYFAKLSLPELWHSLLTEEPKPPFYYFTTLYWIRWAGDSEYALRFLSLVFGVMAVPLTYRLGQALGDDRLGLLTALLLTVAPYQIWHSQEARMYSIFTAASVMSMWGFVKMLPNLTGFQKPIRFNCWRWWLLYVIGTEWAILTHYHALVIIGSQGLFLLLTWRRTWRSYPAWVGTLIVIFLLYVPWLFVSSALLERFLHWLTQPTLWATYIRGVQAYTVGEYMPPAEAIPLVLVFVAVYLLGLVYASRRRWGNWPGPDMLAFLLAYTLAPNLAAWLYGEFRTPVYFERYLIPVQVGFLLTVAIGVLAIYDLRFWIYDCRRSIFHNRKSQIANRKS